MSRVDPQALARNRALVIRKVRSFWIEGVLDQSLHNAVLIDLGMIVDESAVRQPFTLQMRYGDMPARSIPPGTPIFDVYEEFHREILILGDPGSGKTTLLLDLADQLLADAAANDALPIPMIFNLSSWAEQRKPLMEWLEDEMNTRYLVPRAIGRIWLERGAVQPLLDGLDEVALAHRDACVSAINTFRAQTKAQSLVVCSRIKDYDALRERLELSGAVILQALDRQQVEDYLETVERVGQGDQGEFDAVRAVLDEDEKVQRLVNTPLMLNVVMLAYRGLGIDEIPSFETLEGRRRHLFDTYVERMLDRREGSDPQARYTRDQTQHYLSYLAEQMQLDAQSVFHIENAQPDWLTQGHNRHIWRWLGAFITGGIASLVLLLPVFLFIIVPAVLASASFTNTNPWILGTQLTLTAMAPIFFTIGGMFVARRRNLERHRIETVDALRWSWRRALGRIPTALGVSGIVALVMASIFSFFGAGIGDMLLTFLASFVYFGVPFLAIDTIQAGFVVDDIPEKTRPNESVRRSFFNWLRFVGTVTVLTGGFIGLLVGLVSLVGVLSTGPVLGTLSLGTALAAFLGGLSLAIPAALFIGLPFSVLFGLLFRGGVVVIEHAVLRWLLYREGHAPRDYARFLDYAADHILLRKVGGGYIFMHRMLLEHFAQREREKRKHRSDGPGEDLLGERLLLRDGSDEDDQHEGESSGRPLRRPYRVHPS